MTTPRNAAWDHPVDAIASPVFTPDDDAPAAGTRLSELATTGDDDDEGSPLTRMSAHVELDDGTRFDVVVGNRDFVAWDLERPRRKWPTAQDAPFLLNTFLAYTAARRAGLLPPGATFQSFADGAVVVQLSAAEPADPTR